MPRFNFQGQSSSDCSFEQFLREAQRTGLGDPGQAMMQVLKNKRIPGLSYDGIVANRQLNPCGAPRNLLPFLSHICERGAWKIDVNINID